MKPVIDRSGCAWLIAVFIAASQPALDHDQAGTAQAGPYLRVRAIHWRYDSSMPEYRRAHVPGGTCFFTVNT